MDAPDPRERLLRQGATQFQICTRHCSAKCCRYITVEIATPVAERDWDQIRWWLAHQGTLVTKDEDGWSLHVEVRCRHLEGGNTCAVYGNRMIVCEEYDPTDCEFTADYEYEALLASERDLADYLERRGLKRGTRVAASIRRALAAGRRSGPPALVPLEGLEPVDPK